MLHSKISEGFFDPPLQENESQKAWKNRCLKEDKLPRILPAEKYVHERWGLKDCVCDPELSSKELPLPATFAVLQVPKIIRQWDQVLELRTYEPDQDVGPDSPPILLHEDNIVVVFSLNESIGPQWKNIRSKLKAEQKDWKSKEGLPGASSPKGPAWIPALRAWDAEVSNPGMPKSKRAKVLYGDSASPSIDKYTTHLKTAERLINGDYRYILSRQ